MSLMKFNRLETTITVEDVLYTLLSEYFCLSPDDDIMYDTSNYILTLIKSTNKLEYYEACVNDITVFEVILDLDYGTLFIGEIKNKAFFKQLIKNNWDLISKFQFKKLQL